MWVKSYVCRCECFPPLQVSRADHCRDRHKPHSSYLLCCARSHTEDSPTERHSKRAHDKDVQSKVSSFTLYAVINRRLVPETWVSQHQAIPASLFKWNASRLQPALMIKMLLCRKLEIRIHTYGSVKLICMSSHASTGKTWKLHKERPGWPVGSKSVWRQC